MAYYPPVTAYPPAQMPMMPQMGNYTPTMQNAPTGQPAAQQGFSVRPVASREEAMAVQTDFFGPGILMPCLGQGTIWLKRFNANTGASDLLEFVYAPPQTPKTEQFVTMDMFQALCRDVDEIKRGGVAHVSAPDE